jgi:hypothetical protein
MDLTNSPANEEPEDGEPKGNVSEQAESVDIDGEIVETQIAMASREIDLLRLKQELMAYLICQAEADRYKRRQRGLELQPNLEAYRTGPNDHRTRYEIAEDLTETISGMRAEADRVPLLRSMLIVFSICIVLLLAGDFPLLWGLASMPWRASEDGSLTTANSFISTLSLLGIVVSLTLIFERCMSFLSVRAERTLTIIAAIIAAMCLISVPYVLQAAKGLITSAFSTGPASNNTNVIMLQTGLAFVITLMLAFMIREWVRTKRVLRSANTSKYKVDQTAQLQKDALELVARAEDSGRPVDALPMALADAHSLISLELHERARKALRKAQCNGERPEDEPLGDGPRSIGQHLKWLTSIVQRVMPPELDLWSLAPTPENRHRLKLHAFDLVRAAASIQEPSAVPNQPTPKGIKK